MIAAAPVELVERDGRTFQLRRLPGHARPEVGQAVPIRPRDEHGYPLA